MYSIGGDWEEEKEKGRKEEKRKDECFPLSLISVSESLRWSPRAGLPLPALPALGLPSTSQSSRPSERGHETGAGRETLHLAQTLPLLAWVSAVAHGSHKRWPSHTSSSVNKLIWTSLLLLTWEFDLLFVSVLNATCPVLYYGRIRVYVTLFAKKPGLKKKAVFLVMLGTQQSRVGSVLTPLSHPKREWSREAREPRFQHPNKPPPPPRKSLPFSKWVATPWRHGRKFPSCTDVFLISTWECATAKMGVFCMKSLFYFSPYWKLYSQLSNWNTQLILGTLEPSLCSSVCF